MAIESGEELYHFKFANGKSLQIVSGQRARYADSIRFGIKTVGWWLPWSVRSMSAVRLMAEALWLEER